jgi:hypothetical protein
MDYKIIILLLLILVGLYFMYSEIQKTNELVSDMKDHVETENKKITFDIHNNINKCLSKIKDISEENLQQLKKINLLNNQSIKNINHFSEIDDSDADFHDNNFLSENTNRNNPFSIISRKSETALKSETAPRTETEMYMSDSHKPKSEKYKTKDIKEIKESENLSNYIDDYSHSESRHISSYMSDKNTNQMAEIIGFGEDIDLNIIGVDNGEIAVIINLPEPEILQQEEDITVQKNIIELDAPNPTDNILNLNLIQDINAHLNQDDNHSNHSQVSKVSNKSTHSNVSKISKISNKSTHSTSISIGSHDSVLSANISNIGPLKTVNDYTVNELRKLCQTLNLLISSKNGNKWRPLNKDELYKTVKDYLDEKNKKSVNNI